MSQYSDVSDLFFVDVPGGVLVESDQRNVERMLRTALETAVYAQHQTSISDLRYGDGMFPLYYALIDVCSIDWDRLGTSWTVPRGEFAGTFPKRLRSYLNKSFQHAGTANAVTLAAYKLPQSFFAELGAVIGASVNNGKRFACDIVRHFDWYAGDFGDEGSCYWTCRKNDKATLLRSKRFSALRLWSNADTDSEREYAGIGRCWLLKTDYGMAIFNAYGKTDLLGMARLLTQATGLTYHKVRLICHAIYINSDSGYLITDKPEKPCDVIETDLTAVVWCERCDSTTHDTDDCDICARCGEEGCGYCETCDAEQCRCRRCENCELHDCECCENCGNVPDNCDCCSECRCSPCECETCTVCDNRVEECNDYQQWCDRYDGNGYRRQWCLGSDDDDMRRGFDLWNGVSSRRGFTGLALGILELLNRASVDSVIDWDNARSCWVITDARAYRQIPWNGVGRREVA